MKKVVVTGGSGFVASWVIKDFLDHGYQVATSVRSLAKADSIRHELKQQVAPDAIARLSFFEADLTQAAGWREGIKGSAGVIHVASPLGHGTETAAELVNVAQNGALNVLRAAKDVGVNRIVMTSSEAASTPATGSAALLDESFWTDINNPDLDPYRISKVASEQAAWTFARENDLALTTILPGAIFGPAMSEKAMSSNEILLRLLQGQSALPRVPMEISDVRDLATLHRLAFEHDNARGKRYLAASQELTMANIATLYQTNFPELKIKVRVLPNWVTKTAAKFVPSLRTLVPMLDRRARHSTQAAESELGWTQYSPEQTVLDAAKALFALGLVQ